VCSNGIHSVVLLEWIGFVIQWILLHALPSPSYNNITFAASCAIRWRTHTQQLLLHCTWSLPHWSQCSTSTSQLWLAAGTCAGVWGYQWPEFVDPGHFTGLNIWTYTEMKCTIIGCFIIGGWWWCNATASVTSLCDFKHLEL
jgi:hypothetical protein